jgi:replicative DNA helicase
VRLHDDASERLLVCALLEMPKLRRYALQHLHENLFGTKTCLEVYQRMIAIQEQGKEVPTVGVMAHDPGLSPAAQTILKMGPRDRAKLQSFRPSDIDHCLDQVRYYYQCRVYYELNKHLAETFEGSAMADMQEVKADIHQRLLTLEVFDDVSKNTQIIGHGANISDEYMRRHLSRETLKTVPTGYSVLDDRARWGRGNMILLTAKRGQGKSLFAKSLGLSHFNQGQNVITVNLEMDAWEYLCRTFAETSPFTHDALREGLSDKDIKIALGAKKRLDGKGLHWKNPKTGEAKPCRWTLRTVSQPNYTPAQLHNELRHQGYDVVIIDYINLFKQVHKDLWQSLYSHTKYLKMMAKEAGVLLYVLAQLTDEGRAKYARAAEEDSDAWLYWEINRGNPECKFFHGKARHYKPYSFTLIFDYYKMAFVEKESLGWICTNPKCRAEYPKELKQRVRDLKNPTDPESIRLAKEYGPAGIELLSQNKCPRCPSFLRDKHHEFVLDERGKKTRKVYDLEDHLQKLKDASLKDAEEHQQHVDDLNADRARNSEKRRGQGQQQQRQGQEQGGRPEQQRKRHLYALRQQEERDKEKDDASD